MIAARGVEGVRVLVGLKSLGGEAFVRGLGSKPAKSRLAYTALIGCESIRNLLKRDA